MSTNRLVVFLTIIALVSGCARPRDVSATFVAGSGFPTGTVDVILGDATRHLSVTVNDYLVVERKHSRKATIQSVPAGVARIHVVTSGGCEQGQIYDREIEVIPGATTTVALPGPDGNTGCAVFTGLYYVGLNVGLVAIAIAAAAASNAPRIIRGK